jgi:hypothetical protein
MAQMIRQTSFTTAAAAFVACTFFLWMFFAAATLEHAADLAQLTCPPGRDTHAVAYEFAARWRHGMAGNSPLYMPGFFAAAVAIWFWCKGKSLLRLLAEGLLLLAAATVCAAVLAPFAAPRIMASFITKEGFKLTETSASGTWISTAQGVYSLLTWATGVIAVRWSIKLRSLKPMLVPIALNIILALVRPWTVADFTSLWIKRALEGEPAAVFSFLLAPTIAGFVAWIELRRPSKIPALVRES